MTKTTNNNTLLSQKEIDALISFLTQHNKVQDTVLSQESIDKLVSLLQGNGEIDANIFELSDYDTFKSASVNLSDYSLVCNIDEETQYIKITAKNANGNSVKITPAGLEYSKFAKDTSEWGYCIEPAVFDRLASVYKMKYSAEDYETICRIFALKRYGNENAVIPRLYLPTPEALAKNIQN